MRLKFLDFRWMVFAALLCTGVASAAEVRSARFYTNPEYVFVNQPFEFCFEVELPLGCDMTQWPLLEFPEKTEQFSYGEFQELAKIQRKVDGGKTTVDVRRFKSQAFASTAGEVSIRSHLHYELTERVMRGPISFSSSRQAQYRTQPFTLRILSLPEEGKPPNFSGAVGKLNLEATLSAETAQLGDILTLSVAVSGNGDLSNVAVPLPREAKGFKIYPAKEKTREMFTLKAEQAFIPQSTNAVEIGAIHFCYFNPATRKYEETVAGPFRVTVTNAPLDEPKADAVRIINTATSTKVGQGVTIDTVNHGLHRFLPLIVFCSFALVASFVFFQLYGTHTRIGIVLALLLLGAGGGVTHHLRAQPEQATRTTTERAEVRFAPSTNAKVLFILHPDTPVMLIETAGDWVRIDYAGRRGWMPAKGM